MAQKCFLLWFAHEHVAFRIPELESITSLLNIPIRFLESPDEKPFIVCELPDVEAALKLGGRSVLIRHIIELWGHGPTLEHVKHQLKALPPSFWAPYSPKSESFRIDVESFGRRKIPRAKKIEKIEELNFLPFEGSIDLTAPKRVYSLIEYYGLQKVNIPDEPLEVFFGRLVCDGQRQLVFRLSLKHRKFIANTSMDPTLSLIMANLAHIGPHDLVLDPFVGSGSLLVAAAVHGALVFGTDIDYMLLHGRAKPTRIRTKQRDPDEGVRRNLEQYNMERYFGDVIVADASLPLWKNGATFDAIVADPPYGIREATERIGTRKSDYSIPGHLVEQHIPSKVSYSLKEVFVDLLKFAAFHLRVGGRLVLWMPIVRDEYDESQIPRHSGFKLLYICEQTLTAQCARVLLVYEKNSDNNGDEEGATVSCDVSTSFRSTYFGCTRNNGRRREQKSAESRRNGYVQSDVEGDQIDCDDSATTTALDDVR